ncbi:MAG: molybdopterin-dependent oxidoreductase [Methanocorpusculum sp.]|uniref:molybdopterin oxidoreductase family protein n=1 Tax=Methanocorpusculum sp. TaxID=2058474 RepID=UPI002B1F4F97|nr:molybdopterin-dependent oxidoreductase [Methanocorpusculum sp.]MEA5086308.1 molybdopterin-dependent oxidoreductase [Methanocorpusculum sp.]
MQMKYVTTICPYCGTGCALNLVVRDGKTVGVAPSNRSPVCSGKLCSRGLHAADALNEGRVVQPVVKGETSDWETAIGKAAELKKYAAGEIIIITSPRITNETQYLVWKFAHSLGAAIGVIHGGSGVPTVKLDELKDADVILALGNVMQALPLTGNRILQAKENGARLLYLGPQSYTAVQADTVEITDEYKELPPGFGALLKNAAHPAVVYMANDSAAAKLAEGLGISAAVLYDTNNGRGTSLMGIGPLSLQESTKAALVIAETPLMEQDIYADILQKLDSLELTVVAASAETSLSAIADIVLPIASQHESDGTVTNWEGRVQMLRKAVDSPVGVKSLQEVLAELAEKMGLGIPSGTPEEMYTALAGEISAFGNSTYEQIAKPEGVFVQEV